MRMFCFLLLVGLLTGAAKGEGQEIVTTDPPSSSICVNRTSHPSYETFIDICGNRSGNADFTYNPLESDSYFLTFEDAISKIEFYDLSSVTPETELDRQCVDALQQLLCFMFFPQCDPTWPWYVTPCYDNCVDLKAVCHSFITNVLTAVGVEDSPPELNCTRLQQEDTYSDTIEICLDIPVPVDDDGSSCSNRTTDPDYDEYNLICGHFRGGTSAHFTFNPPHYDPRLTFAAAVQEQRQYVGVVSPPDDVCENPLKTKCYYILEQLMCLSLFPECNEHHYFSLCLDSCNEAKALCEPVLSQLGISSWPQRLECSRFNTATDDTRLYVCAPLPDIELSCTTTIAPVTPTIVQSTTMTTSATMTTTSTTIIPSTTMIPYTTMITSTSTTTTSVMPRQTPVNYLCDVIPNCAKVRSTVSGSKFKCNKYEFALKGTPIEIIKLITGAHGAEIAYRVRVEQDYDLCCNGKQYERDDIVVVHSDQSCVGCIDMTIEEDYLLMGSVSSSRILYHSNGDNDDGWTLEAIKGSGGCVVSPWETRYDDKICSSWLNGDSCTTRDCP